MRGSACAQPILHRSQVDNPIRPIPYRVLMDACEVPVRRVRFRFLQHRFIAPRGYLREANRGESFRRLDINNNKIARRKHEGSTVHVPDKWTHSLQISKLRG